MKTAFGLLLAVLILTLGAPAARAQSGCITGGTGCPSSPEMDPSVASSSLALFGGVALLIRSRRKQ